MAITKNDPSERQASGVRRSLPARKSNREETRGASTRPPSSSDTLLDLPVEEILRSPLPEGLTASELFFDWEPASLKLYLWLRSKARIAPPESDDGVPESGVGVGFGYIVADVSGAEIERSVGVSKNTITKLARDLQERGIASFSADRVGYHFRLGEWTLYRRRHEQGPAGQSSTIDPGGLSLGALAIPGFAYYLDLLV